MGRRRLWWETVKTVGGATWRAYTSLKRGVNERVLIVPVERLIKGIRGARDSRKQPKRLLAKQ